MNTSSNQSQIPILLQGDLDIYSPGTLVVVTGSFGTVIFQNEHSGFQLVLFEPENGDL